MWQHSILIIILLLLRIDVTNFCLASMQEPKLRYVTFAILIGKTVKFCLRTTKLLIFVKYPIFNTILGTVSNYATCINPK